MNTSLSNPYNFLPRFYKLALTNILSSIVVPLSGLIDLAFLGHLPDIRYLAGVSLATIIFSYLYKVLNFLRSSSNGMTAQAVGANNSEGILLVLLRNGLIALGVGLLILILQYPIQLLGFNFLVGATEVKNAGLDYFQARIWGAPAVLLNFVLVGWFFGREMNGFVVLLSVIEGLTNIVLDYFFIIRWGWGSTGAGLTTAMSQYLALFVGLIIASFHIDWSFISTVSQKILDLPAIKAIFKLNGNMLIKNLAVISTFSLFTELGSAMGTDILARNSVLLQAAIFNMFIIQGVGYATQSLTGNFKGQGASEQLKPLLTTGFISSIFLSVPVAILYIVFPEPIFGLLTNHNEITESMVNYLFWLLPFQGFCAVNIILEGYFIGLTEGGILRNSAIVSLIIAFLPIAIAAGYFHNNHLLWLALVLSQIASVIVFGVRLIEEWLNNYSSSTSVQN
ncbi:guanitoxin biosynthesis MATE family efflux transporter GntT [Sphaerospermopsis sp. LEGE 08334]|uniref:guanitoxin biosynthesis MATE family efflux transporter GntT n=1 Tax=Sphaerospermopsis sp. LEGE 08334 TaxID=1828651 RepID=UPI0018818CE8|nr:guanitoxin biosynthesis MATE family efflux transporter GntT [Sphaerospermopsis sp. LEGE 08334]MBE9056838.1 MATE family efflux transporter [Sphaerospermopsis sp. LEGE 08334]